MKLLLPDSPVPKVQTRPAPRPDPEKTLKIGLLDNTKPNGDAIIQWAFDALVAQGIRGEAKIFRKVHAGIGIKPEMLAQLAQCDLVFTAIAN